jgi:[ribosomal protein S18]-alanine N-acetyltransferase
MRLPTFLCSVPLRLHVRDMTRRDLTAVRAIDAVGSSPPWRDDEFLTAIPQRARRAVVAEHGDRLVGFAVYRPTCDTYHLLRLVVDPLYRRRGVGRQLVASLSGLGVALSATERESNLGAHLFLRACGFRAKLVPGAFRDTGEDAYVFGMTGAAS